MPRLSRKLISVLMSVMMAVSCLTLSAVPAFADDDVFTATPSSDTVAVGEEFTVTYHARAFTASDYCTLMFTIPTTDLQLVSVTPAVLAKDGGMTVQKDFGAISASEYAADMGAGIFAEGDICTLTLRALRETSAATVMFDADFDDDLITCRATVAVTEQVTAIRIDQAPDTTAYYEGQVFDPTGMVVTAVYSGGTEADVPEDEYTIDIAGAQLTPDITQAVISYSGCTAAQPITVAETEALRAEYTDTYTVGDSFDLSTLTVYAVFDDLTELVIPSEEYTVTVSDPLTVDDHEVLISSRGLDLSLPITVNLPLDYVKLSAIKDISDYAQSPLYRDAQNAQMLDILKNAIADINEATSVEEVGAVVTAAEAAIDDLPTDEELTADELVQAKLDTLYELLNACDLDDYREEQKTEITEILNDAAQRIEAAQTVDELEVIREDVLAQLFLVPDDEEMAAAELAEAIEDAFAELAAFMGTINLDDYRDAQQLEIATVEDLAQDMIAAAETPEEVQEILDEAIETINAIPTDAELTAEELETARENAITALENYADPDDYDEEQQAELAEAVQDGIDAIAAAETIDEVEDAFDAAVDVIDLIPTSLDLLKVDAMTELLGSYDPDDYREEQQAEIQQILVYALQKITQAATPEDVEADYDAAVNAIVNVPTAAELTAAELQETKLAAIEALTAWADLEQYRESGQAEIMQIVQAAAAAIGEAETAEDVATILEEALEDLDAVATDEEVTQLELLLAKIAAVAELSEAVDPEDYRAEQQEQLAALIDAGIEAIADAETMDILNAVVEEYMTQIYEIPTDEELTAEELEEAREEALVELAGFLETINPDDYRDAQKTELALATLVYTAAIQKAEDEDAVAEILEAAIEEISAIPTDAELTAEELEAAKEEATEDLEDYADPDDYDEEHQAQLARAIEAGCQAIADAETIEEVDAALEEAKEAVDRIPTKLRQAQNEAASTLTASFDEDDYREEQKEAVQEAWLSGLREIWGANDEEEVAEALAAALNVIDNIPTAAELDAADLESAKLALSEEVTAYADTALYRTEQQAIILQVVQGAVKGIGEAETQEEAEQICELAKFVIDLLPTDEALTEKELAEAKEAALAELGDYADPEDYREVEQLKLELILVEAAQAINEAETAEAVQDTLLAAEAAIDALPTDAELAAQELEQARADGRVQMGEAMLAIDAEAYREEQLADIVARATLASEMISLAMTPEDVQDIVDAFIEYLVSVPTDAELTEEELEQAKLRAIEELTTYADAADYREEQQAQLLQEISAGIARIQAAETEEEVEDALIQTESNIGKIPTSEEIGESELQEAKVNAMAAIATAADPADYREEQQEALAEIIESAAQALAAAGDLDTVQMLKEEALEAIDALPTDAELTEEELDEVKQQALTLLDEFMAEFDLEAYRPEQQLQMGVARALTEAMIENAETQEQVVEALEAGMEAINEIPTDEELTEKELQEAKEAAAEELAGFVNPDDYLDPQKEEIATVISDAAESLAEARTIEEVEEILAEAEIALAGIPTAEEIAEEELEEAKDIASDELLNSYDPGDYEAAEIEVIEGIIAVAQKAIDNAASIEELEDVIAEAEAAIAAVPKEALCSFVTRLYRVCLDREPDENGKAYWVEQLKSKQQTGVQVASGFIFSKEFKEHNYCNTCFVEHLYLALMGREPDAAGMANWIGKLEGGMKREEVFNGFALSNEFSNLCAEYEIDRGSGIGIPQYGTIPEGPCAGCGAEDGVTAFVKRLYDICLGREADESGLKNWTSKLWSHTQTGKEVAFGFVFSREFQNMNLNNEEFVDCMYAAFFGRAADLQGKTNWVNQLNAGKTRESVFNGFADSQEFSNLCAEYGITAN